jgi:hypothetical protein
MLMETKLALLNNSERIFRKSWKKLERCRLRKNKKNLKREVT